MSMRAPAFDALAKSDEPSLRYKLRAHVLGENPESRAMLALRREIKRSPRVQALLTEHLQPRQVNERRNVYDKWQGAHWVMASLADLGYPPGDRELIPLRDRLLDAWLAPHYYEEFECDSRAAAYRRPGVPIISGRHRRCASQQGNALYAIASLGLADTRTKSLLERLLHWQWPDGGWNCDKKPTADTSSFMETLTPLRGLAASAAQGEKRKVSRPLRRAADVFLERQLFRRRSNGATIKKEFVKLHYPLYWHYDILGGLKALAEAGLVHDARCAEALALLESKRLPDGGFPAEQRYYASPRGKKAPGSAARELVDWGGTSARASNPWVTADALAVLAAARA
jgi:hypothetical protein